MSNGGCAKRIAYVSAIFSAVHLELPVEPIQLVLEIAAIGVRPTADGNTWTRKCLR